ncbi:MAG TPA: phosphatidylglycerol lysyltransferase domain-containing protein [Solirubrobacteraceae bacterium]|nr:phosphatidylglycerol lysyltransferase domain-containing protein [Solirubrobacteraceae bacterium]
MPLEALRKHAELDHHWLPATAAVLTALVGLVNIASALTPDIRWRGHLLLHLEGVRAMEIFHALALPAGAALLLVSPYLFKRRRRALQIGIALLLAIGVVNLFKGLDFEESILGWAVALMLYWGRSAFTVVQAPVRLRSVVWRVPLIGAFGVALVSFADWITSGRPKVGAIIDESASLVRFKRGQLRFENHTLRAFGHVVSFQWMPLAIHFTEIATLLGMAYVLFRPLATPRAWPSASVRRMAVQLVRQHGNDTLSFFKLRPDKHYFFNTDRTAFVGYRVEAGALLLSGDPVGPPAAFGDVLLEVHRFARARGLKLAALGASERLVPIYRGLGLHTLYLGDEAVVELESFSLEGRPIRKVRQSVHRLRKAGYTSALCKPSEIDPETMRQMEYVLKVGRIGQSERGFSMGMDGIHCALEQDTLFVLARDGEGALRGVLHFVPCYGRSAMSLSIMRRDPATPNGLMEFLVVAAIESMRERGIKEISLNFAALTKYMRDPQNPFERLLGRVAALMNPYLQIESLYRFNVKFQPRWDPRYLVYEGSLGIARAGVAAMWAEGQMPKPKLPRTQARLGQRTLKTANR